MKKLLLGLGLLSGLGQVEAAWYRCKIVSNLTGQNYIEGVVQADTYSEAYKKCNNVSAGRYLEFNPVLIQN